MWQRLSNNSENQSLFGEILGLQSSFKYSEGGCIYVHLLPNLYVSQSRRLNITILFSSFSYSNGLIMPFNIYNSIFIPISHLIQVLMSSEFLQTLGHYSFFIPLKEVMKISVSFSSFHSPFPIWGKSKQEGRICTLWIYLSYTKVAGAHYMLAPRDSVSFIPEFPLFSEGDRLSKCSQ